MNPVIFQKLELLALVHLWSGSLTPKMAPSHLTDLLHCVLTGSSGLSIDMTVSFFLLSIMLLLALQSPDSSGSCILFLFMLSYQFCQ